MIENNVEIEQNERTHVANQGIEKKIQTKIKKTTKHTFQKICCKEDAIRKYRAQRLSCRKNESSIGAKNNYNK